MNLGLHCIKYVLLNFVSLSLVDSTLDLNCQNNVAIYWGQNSFGGRHLNEKNLWEKDLKEYCKPDSINNNANIINLSFLHIFNADTDKLPEINLANHCEDYFNKTAEFAYVHKCYEVGQDIKYCQEQNKTILLSLGGATSNAGFQSSSSARKFAHTIWNMFLGGTHKIRPFNDAVIDGIDLDIEGGSNLYYENFVSELRSLYKKDVSKKYYVSAAPQCVFPDHALNNVLSNAEIDMIFLQYYNNWCGIQNFDNRWAWNFDEWLNFVRSGKAFNKDMKLYLGAPASQTAASSGYIDHFKLENIIRNISTNNEFGGIMFWDASQAQNNLVGPENLPYDNIIKRYLDQTLNECGNKNPPSTTTTSIAYPNPTTTHEESKTKQTSSSTFLSTVTTSSSSSSYPSTTSTTSSNILPIPTNSPKQPKDTNCAIQGNHCSKNGQFECNGNTIMICHNNNWVGNTCQNSTTCIKTAFGGAICMFGNTPKCDGILYNSTLMF